MYKKMYKLQEDITPQMLSVSNASQILASVDAVNTSMSKFTLTLHYFFHQYVISIVA
jgi:hypothetical protein